MGGAGSSFYPSFWNSLVLQSVPARVQRAHLVLLGNFSSSSALGGRGIFSVSLLRTRSPGPPGAARQPPRQTRGHEVAAPETSLVQPRGPREAKRNDRPPALAADVLPRGGRRGLAGRPDPPAGRPSLEPPVALRVRRAGTPRWRTEELRAGSPPPGVRPPRAPPSTAHPAAKGRWEELAAPPQPLSFPLGLTLI